MEAKLGRIVNFHLTDLPETVSRLASLFVREIPIVVGVPPLVIPAATPLRKRKDSCHARLR